jgi:Tfp pilus assembly protein PilX
MKQHKGYALVTILILLGVCMFGATALMTISILESKISKSQTEGDVAYYAAEAGVNDAIWRLNNNATYKQSMADGTLSVSYSTTDTPATGQGFTTTMTTPAQGAGYALISVVGTSNNGTFTSTRQVQATVFQGGGSPSFGSNAIFGGDSTNGIAVSNGNSSVTISGGDIFSRGPITVNSASVSMAGQYMQAVGNYTKSGNGTVTSAGTHAANVPVAPATITTPGFDFSPYPSLPTTKCTAALYAAQTQLRCTPAQFQALIGNNSSFSFPNQVVYVDAALSMASWIKNKTITFNGLFIINGTFSITNAASNLVINVNDPGNGKSGIIVKSDITNAAGTWNINGIVYSSGKITFSSSQAATIDGALVAGGAISLNTSLSLNISFNAGRGTAVLGGSSPTAVNVAHWEEEY